MGSFYVKTSKGANAQGPFTAAQLKALAAKGKLRSDYLVSKDGHVWYLAGNITDLPRPQHAPAPQARPGGAAAGGRRRPRPQAPPPAKKSAVAVLAEEVRAVREEGIPRTRRFPAATVAGVVLGLATAGIVAYVFFAGPGGGGEEPNDLALAGPAGTAAQDERPPRADTPPAGPAASGRPAGASGVAPAAAGRHSPPATPPPPASPPAAPAPAVPPPPPAADLEPTRPEACFQVFSVSYGGQAVLAMGSELTFHLTNLTGRTIRAAKGHLWLYGPDGAFIKALPVELDEAVKPGEKVSYSNVWMTVRGPTYGLLDTAADRMRFRFAADEVTYEDGTTEKLH